MVRPVLLDIDLQIAADFKTVSVLSSTKQGIYSGNTAATAMTLKYPSEVTYACNPSTQKMDMSLRTAWAS